MTEAPLIILVGGTTATGKSFIGRRLAEELGIQYVSGDQLRTSLQSQSSRDDPIGAFHGRSPDVYLAGSVDELCRQQEMVSSETCARAFQPCLEGAVAESRSILLEGDDILPAFAAEWRERIGARALFAVEEDPRMPLARQKAPSGIVARIQTFAAVHHRRGQAIAREARSLGFLVVPPRSERKWRRALGLSASTES